MRKLIKEIIDYAAWVSDAKEIHLFGSMADSSCNAHSDIDLLIVTDSFGSRSEIIDRVRKYAQEFSLSADVLVHTSDEIEGLEGEPTSFVSSVLRYGKILYKKAKEIS